MFYFIFFMDHVVASLGKLQVWLISWWVIELKNGSRYVAVKSEVTGTLAKKQQKNKANKDNTVQQQLHCGH